MMRFRRAIRATPIVFSSVSFASLLSSVPAVIAVLAFLHISPGGASAASNLSRRLCSNSSQRELDTNLVAAGIVAANQEKRARTPAQKKIDSQLLYAIYRQRGEAEAKGVPSGELGVKFDEKGRAIVGIRARVTKTVLAKIRKAGGEIISRSERYNDIQAHVPLEKLERLAALKDVYAIMPAPEAMTNGRPR